MFRAIRLAWFGSLLCAFGAGAQTNSAILDRDIRLFAFNAALNVAGFDVELAPSYHPVREALRTYLEDRVDDDLRRRLNGFYESHKVVGTEVDQIAPYVSLALNVGDPPGFEFLYPEDQIPLDARDVAEFLPLVRELYETAGLTQFWGGVAPAYQDALDRLSGPIRETLVGSEAYLRDSSAVSTSRRVVILIELTAPVNSVNVRNYPDNLYVVLGDAAVPPVGRIRHGYLHLLLDPLLAASRGDFRDVSALLSLTADVDGVQPEYAVDIETMLGESLIRAVELRMDAAQSAPEDLDQAYRLGLLLTPYFYEQLGIFESGSAGIRVFFPRMVADMDLRAERDRFSSEFFAIPVPETVDVAAEIPVRRDPVPAVLEEAREAFNEGEDALASELFSRVLAEFDSGNGPALYGMALIASRRQDPEAAREYFVRTLTSESAEPLMIAWSHVYLGRIDDIGCERQQALEHYRAAMGVMGETGGAREAAAQGVAGAFGGADEFCR